MPTVLRPNLLSGAALALGLLGPLNAHASGVPRHVAAWNEERHQADLGAKRRVDATRVPASLGRVRYPAPEHVPGDQLGAARARQRGTPARGRFYFAERGPNLPCVQDIRDGACVPTLYRFPGVDLGDYVDSCF